MSETQCGQFISKKKAYRIGERPQRVELDLAARAQNLYLTFLADRQSHSDDPAQLDFRPRLGLLLHCHIETPTCVAHRRHQREAGSRKTPSPGPKCSYS